ncbi:protein of unknown function (DUF1870) [Promicromonospora umidemergens]|uniref:Helix-turn-helix protein n=1 Tax=Promicromonospora umidemergens TaxID=629679 RepID=A0ABP8XIQ6_9MICO|nr:DUF1870 family protein [Promicromonospora umidemergens]MCP2282798.1 protein of unknown function (DUF1870) [Promicromonospora umidemergens]
MGNEPMQRMTGSEVQCAREALGLERVDLARLIGNDAATVRDWERGKTFVPFRVREEIGELEALTGRTVEQLVADLREMSQSQAMVYREDEQARADDVARLGRRWWRVVATRAAAQVPGTRIGTRAELDAMNHEP